MDIIVQLFNAIKIKGLDIFLFGWEKANCLAKILWYF
jgi:hypothetical protein